MLNNQKLVFPATTSIAQYLPSELDSTTIFHMYAHGDIIDFAAVESHLIWYWHYASKNGYRIRCVSKLDGSEYFIFNSFLRTNNGRKKCNFIYGIAKQKSNCCELLGLMEGNPLMKIMDKSTLPQKPSKNFDHISFAGLENHLHQPDKNRFSRLPEKIRNYCNSSYELADYVLKRLLPAKKNFSKISFNEDTIPLNNAPKDDFLISQQYNEIGKSKHKVLNELQYTYLYPICIPTVTQPAAAMAFRRKTNDRRKLISKTILTLHQARTNAMVFQNVDNTWLDPTRWNKDALKEYIEEIISQNRYTPIKEAEAIIYENLIERLL